MDLDVALGSRPEETIATLANLGWAVVAFSWTVDADRALRAAGLEGGGGGGGKKRKAPEAQQDTNENGEDEDDDEDETREKKRAPKSFWAQLPPPERLGLATGGEFPPEDYFARRRNLDADAEGPPDALEIERYTRLTVDFQSLPGLNHVLQHPTTALFDLVVLRISSARALDVVMQIVREPGRRQLPFDALQIPLAEEDKLPFRIGPVDMLQLRRARVFVEVNYLDVLPISGAITKLRSRALANGRMLLEHTSGGSMKKAANTNIVISSGAQRASALQLRAPEQVAAIATTLGLTAKQAQCAITTNGEALLERARARRAIR